MLNKLLTPLLTVLNIIVIIALITTNPVSLNSTSIKGPYEVLRVIDGDTLILSIDNTKTRVRLIGIDTPELYTPFYNEATLFLMHLIDNQMIYLEYDQTHYDKYNRTLAYLYLEDKKTMVNDEILKAGWAKLMIIPPNDKYEVRFYNTSKKAKQQRRGLYQSP